MPFLFLIAGAAILYELMTPKAPERPTAEDKQAFVSRLRVIARRVESEGATDSYTGARVPPGIKADFGISQLAVESAFGTSALALNAFNLSGLTADPDAATYWATRKYPTYQILTTEHHPDGSPYQRTRYFRRYNSIEESYIDWARLLYSAYPEAFAAAQVGNFAGFAQGLQDRGYALNDHLYASKILRFGSEVARIA